MHISVLFIMFAFALVSLKAGTFDFSGFKDVLAENVHFANLIFMLLFVGFGTKAGFVPFHNWLPDAHPAAPSHVSAIMSGVMIKTGIYGILRTISLIGTPSKSISYTVLIISLVSALYGVLYAICQHDLKRLLAYHSIENIGIIGIGIGVGMLGLAYNHPIVAVLGFAGGILHILNHSIFKELLFLSAGSVYTKTHTRNIEVLGGLIKSMPKSAILFLIGSVAICGLPPFNGFISEFLVYLGMFKGLAIQNFFSCIMILFAIAGLALVGTMAVLCFSKAFSIIFLGMPRSEAAQHVKEDASCSMILPMSFLALLTLIIGLCPKFVFDLMLKPVSVLANVSDVCLCEPIELMTTIEIFAGAFVLFVIALIIVKLILTKGKIEMHETWGCGYNRANNHMQYTASSYASPFLSMLNPLFKKVFDIEKPKKLFPQSAHFSLHVEDIEEAYVIEPVLKSDEWFLSKFEGLQSGNIQAYIKYGLIFLLIVIIGSLFM
jgi:formate hydrogenlyase subunit 3/multisubunit Na+/H+ antiporter MnhD subunit